MTESRASSIQVATEGIPERRRAPLHWRPHSPRQYYPDLEEIILPLPNNPVIDAPADSSPTQGKNEVQEEQDNPYDERKCRFCNGTLCKCAKVYY